jgi:hypothetical protein
MLNQYIKSEISKYASQVGRAWMTDDHEAATEFRQAFMEKHGAAPETVKAFEKACVYAAMGYENVEAVLVEEVN